MSKEDWIILRLMRNTLRKGGSDARAWRDLHETALYLLKKYGWEQFDAAVTALEIEEGLK
jgi:hypothetical protein